MESMDFNEPSSSSPSFSTRIPIETGGEISSLQENPAKRRRKSSTINNRILCPVVGCLESLTSSTRHFKDFASIKPHIDEHCTGYHAEAVP